MILEYEGSRARVAKRLRIVDIAIARSARSYGKRFVTKINYDVTLLTA